MAGFQLPMHGRFWVPTEGGRATGWCWSSARAHFAGVDADELLCLDRWQHVFGKTETIAADWAEFVEGPEVERAENAVRVRRMATGSRQNRPRRWVAPAVTFAAGSPPG